MGDETRRPSLNRTGTGGTSKFSKNAHPVSQVKNSKTINGSGSSDLELNAFKDKWEHEEQTKVGLKNIVKWIVGELKDERLAIHGVERFLKDKDAKVDDCVRWFLLLHAIDPESHEVKEEDKKGNEVRSQLIETLIKARPHLAFGNINDHKHACAKERWHSGLKDKRTPLHLAISERDSRTVQTMIEQGKMYYNKTSNPEHSQVQHRARQMESESPNFSIETCQLVEIMNRKDLHYSDRPLERALKGQPQSPEIIHTLLKVTDDDSVRQDFERVLQDGGFGAVEAFLDITEVAEKFVTKDLVVKALENLKAVVKGGHGSGKQSKDDEMRVAKLMVKTLKSSQFDCKIAEMIIQVGSTDLWEARDERELEDGLKGHLLHLAVRNRHYGFVQRFINQYPSSVTKRWAYSDRTGEQYPLWYNNHDDSGAKINDPHKDIRAEITNKMIQEESEMGNLFDMFHSCHEQVDELCFDLSRFDSAGFQVSTFIDSMISQPLAEDLIKFENTLRYAEFPPLDVPKDKRESFRDSCHLRYEHREVFRILDWLRKSMHVQTIIRLKVPDRLVNSHDEDDMARYVEMFQVQILDWKALDLCLDTLHQESKERITELHLYSSGKRSVISHWFSREGIQSMPRLKVIKIYIVQETCTSNRRQKVEEVIKNKLEAYTGKVTSVSRISWYPTTQQPNLMKIARRIDPKLGQWLESLNAYHQHTRGDFTPTKVAILDNGVLSVSPTSATTAVPCGDGGSARDIDYDSNDKSRSSNSSHRQSPTEAKSSKGKVDDHSLSSRIKGGRSFVAGRSSHSPWHLACNPHGTQMANLICAMDPLCDIYIARVAEDALGITPDRVEKAIEWAIEKEVDIISMSFTIGKEGSIGAAIDKASKKGIVMTCSTHDEGSKTEQAWPASFIGKYKTLIVLAACDEWGRTLRNIEKRDYDFLVPGQNVSTGNIPFLKSKDKISGSSVATALAAGICSLTITCDRMANSGLSYEEGDAPGSRYERVVKELKSMKSGIGSEPIVPRKFGGIDRASLGGNPSARDILDKFKRPYI